MLLRYFEHSYRQTERRKNRGRNRTVEKRDMERKVSGRQTEVEEMKKWNMRKEKW